MACGRSGLRFCPRIDAMNSTNLTVALDFSEFTNVFIAIGVAHLLLVVIPSLILGPLILGVFISNKKQRDSVSILFMCITVVCILGPLTYGLLQDLSLITDFALLGPCEIFRGRLFWFSLAFFQVLLTISSAILVAVQYVTVRWGKKLSIRGTILTFISFVFFVFLVSLTNLISLLDTNPDVVVVRGSLCYRTLALISVNIFLVQGLLVLSIIAISYIIVVLLSILIVKYIKRHTINNKKVVRDVLIIMVAFSTSIIIFRLVPVLRFVIMPNFNIVENISLSFFLDYSIDFSYPLFLILTLFVHKTVRTTFSKTLKYSYVKKAFGIRPNRVSNSANI